MIFVCVCVLKSNTLSALNSFARVLLVLEIVNLCILMKAGTQLQPTSFSYSHVPQS